MIQAVLFDLDETLLDRQTSLRSFLSFQWEKNEPLQKAEKNNFIEKFLQLDDNGRVWKDHVYATIINDFSLKDIDVDHLLQEYVADLKKFAQFFPMAQEAVVELKRRGLKLGIISNSRPAQLEIAASMGLNKLMDVILISDIEGIRKPDPKIFYKALAILNVYPENAVFIGDNLVADIEGATNVGMKTIWKRNNFQRMPPAMPTYHFEKFDDFFVVFDELCANPIAHRLLCSP